MKKLFLATACLLCSFAVNATPEEEQQEAPIAAQYIVTECGTVHQVSLDASVEEIIWAIDHYTQLDC